MKKILVIDDNENMLRMVRDLLIRSGYQVCTAGEGVEGIKVFHRELPDMVITDIIMPDKEGLEVIMDLAKVQPKPKIIAMSGGGMMEPRTYLLLAQKLGANHTIEKPFRPAELLAVIEKLFAE